MLITWTTFVLGIDIDAGANPHRDLHNRAGSSNYVFGFGKYQKGEVRQPSPSGSKARTEWKVLPSGQRVRALKLNVKNKMCELAPRLWHGSEEWTGTRYLLGAFTSRSFDDTEPCDLQEFKHLGFPVPRHPMLRRYDGTVNNSAVASVSVYVEDVPGDDARGAQRHVHDETEPTTEEKRLVRKLHENLGHPDPKMMARSIRLARAKPHIVRYLYDAQKFRCEVCAAKRKPKPARPAVLPRCYESGKVVGIDTLYLRALDQRDSFPCLNITDWGTGYQVVERLKRVDASHAWRTFLRVWGRVFGVPEVLIVDLGPEFRGDFADRRHSQELW